MTCFVTTECINYIRTSNRNTPADAALYPPLENPQTAALADAARQANAWLVAGYAFREGTDVYTAALIFDRTGTLRQVYRKTHLAGDESAVLHRGTRSACRTLISGGSASASAGICNFRRLPAHWPCAGTAGRLPHLGVGGRLIWPCPRL